MKMRKIILYGCGTYCEKFYLSLCLGRKEKLLAGVIDTYKKGKFYGFDIHASLNEIPDYSPKTHLIVIPTGWKVFTKIREGLKTNGLVEFGDFVWYKILIKKICVINANCMQDPLKILLAKSEQFNRKYCIYSIPYVHENKADAIPESLIDRIDLYIHQDIREGTGGIPYKLSDAYMLNRVKKECRCICIPNMVTMGKIFYPNLEPLEICKYRASKNDAFYRDYYLDEILESEQFINASDVISVLYNRHYRYRDSIEMLLNKLQLREQAWDIKVSDYVRNNYKTSRLFNDINHASPCLVKYICMEFLKLLDITDINADAMTEKELSMGMGGLFLPFVLNGLNCNYGNEIRYRSRVSDTSIDATGFVKEYAFIVHGVILR